jgi:hypothetical protein
LKIRKKQSKPVDRRTDNTMAKRKEKKDKQRSIKHTYKTKDSEIFQERFEDIKNEIRNRRSKEETT